MTDKYRQHMHAVSYAQAMEALRKAILAGHPDQHIWHAYCVGLCSA